MIICRTVFHAYFVCETILHQIYLPLLQKIGRDKNNETSNHTMPFGLRTLLKSSIYPSASLFKHKLIATDKTVCNCLYLFRNYDTHPCQIRTYYLLCSNRLRDIEHPKRVSVQI